jgi:hypothetical protein
MSLAAALHLSSKLNSAILYLEYRYGSVEWTSDALTLPRHTNDPDISVHATEPDNIHDPERTFVFPDQPIFCPQLLHVHYLITYNTHPLYLTPSPSSIIKLVSQWVVET